MKTNFRCSCRVSGLLLFVLVAVTAHAGKHKLNYMDRFSEEERQTEPHVKSSTCELPQDFVDGQWEGIIAASDGSTYFSVSSHSPHHNAQFYRFLPEEDRVEHLINVARWCGQSDAPGKWNAQGKIHSTIYEHEKKLYMSSCAAHRTPDRPYPGGHFLRYHLETARFEDLGVDPTKEGCGLLTMLFEPKYKRMYANHPKLRYLDLKTGKHVTIGKLNEGYQCRVLIADKYGNVYGSRINGEIWKYNPRTDEINTLEARVPSDPNLETKPNKKGTGQWINIVKDPETDWYYSVRRGDEYLFRFKPPEKPDGLKGKTEGLAPFGFRPEKADRGSLGLCLRGRTLWYCSYPIWRKQAHLMSYHIPSGKTRNHGKIICEKGRRVSEIHSLVVGADNKLHAVAMVWSIKGEDPANPWANRAQCFFHARFMVIDPEKDLKNQ
ncbi:MAG: hypothetical protein ACLFWL_03050 [Candidatus Brocadiia bacterium]